MAIGPAEKAKSPAVTYTEQARAAAALSQWIIAEACLEAAKGLDPKNRDIVFFHARVKAWQNKHDAALAILDPWPPTDVESREIRGDLAWYRGDPIDAEKWYRSNLTPEASIRFWKTWLKALRAKGDDHFPKALNETLVRFPGDPDLLLMKAQPFSPVKVPEKDSVENDNLKDLEANIGKPEAFVPLAPSGVDTLENENLKQIEANLEKEMLEEPAVPSPLLLPKGKRYKSKKLSGDKPQYRAAAAATVIRETQDQSLHSEDVDAAIIANRKSVALGASSITRDYGPVTFTDTPFRLALGLGLAADPGRFFQSQETTVTLGGAPHPTFTPVRFGSVRHEIFFSGAWSLWGEVGAKWYPNLYARTTIMGADISLNTLRYQVKIINTRAKRSDTAGFISVGYQAYKVVPEVYVLGGRDAASRPYLLGREEESFLAVGVNLGYRFATHWAARAVIEQRSESGFRQQTLSLALLWYDR